MSSSTESCNVDSPLMYPGIKKVDYTSELNINEPSLNTIPTFRVLNYAGEIVVNNRNSITVSAT